MQSLSKYNKRIKCLLCAIDLFNKYVWVLPLKDKRGISIVNAFPEISSKGRKPNKIWVDQGGEFYNKLFKRFLKKITLKCIQHTIKENLFLLKDLLGLWKTRVSKNLYFNVLDEIINKYKNTVHRSIKMKPIDVTSDSYAEYNEDSNEKDPKFKVGDHVRISKYKNIFAKWYTQNWSEEVFVASKIKNTVPWAYVISDLNGEPITWSFYEKKLQKTNQEKFRIEKVLQRKGDKLCVKWKGYDSRFNSLVDNE